MDPLVKTYLMWAGFGAVLAVILYFVMQQREEVPTKWRPFVAVGVAAFFVVAGPSGRSRWTRSRTSSFSRSVASAKASSAADQALRESAKKALDKSQGSTDFLDATTLVNIANVMHDRGWSSEALPLYDRAYAMFLAKGAGEGNWNIDAWVLKFSLNYVEDLKAEGRSRESGGVLVLDQKLRGLHASKLPK